jgi:hypothetical protein
LPEFLEPLIVTPTMRQESNTKWSQSLTGCCSNQFSLGLKRVLIIQGSFQAIPKLIQCAQPVGIALLSFRQDLRIKNISISAQRDFRLGSNPLNCELSWHVIHFSSFDTGPFSSPAYFAICMASSTAFIMAALLAVAPETASTFVDCSSMIL